jgi:hypothetical protein
MRYSFESRCRAVRAIVAGAPVGVVAAAQGVSRATVYRWWRRYRSGGWAGLHDRAAFRGTASRRCTRPALFFAPRAPGGRRSKRCTTRALAAVARWRVEEDDQQLELVPYLLYEPEIRASSDQVHRPERLNAAVGGSGALDPMKVGDICRRRRSERQVIVLTGWAALRRRRPRRRGCSGDNFPGNAPAQPDRTRTASVTTA